MKALLEKLGFVKSVEQDDTEEKLQQAMIRHKALVALKQKQETGELKPAQYKLTPMHDPINRLSEEQENALSDYEIPDWEISAIRKDLDFQVKCNDIWKNSKG